jgi:hypothetical protein
MYNNEYLELCWPLGGTWVPEWTKCSPTLVCCSALIFLICRKILLICFSFFLFAIVQPSPFLLRRCSKVFISSSFPPFFFSFFPSKKPLAVCFYPVKNVKKNAKTKMFTLLSLKCVNTQWRFTHVSFRKGRDWRVFLLLHADKHLSCFSFCSFVCIFLLLLLWKNRKRNVKDYVIEMKRKKTKIGYKLCLVPKKNQELLLLLQ